MAETQEALDAFKLKLSQKETEVENFKQKITEMGLKLDEQLEKVKSLTLAQEALQ